MSSPHGDAVRVRRGPQTAPNGARVLRVRARRFVLLAASGLAVAATPLVPTGPASAAAPATIAGVDTSGFAAPVSVLIYEPEIPIPTEPQGELRYAYTEASLQSGPFATALASSVYPGPTLTNGLQQFNPFPQDCGPLGPHCGVTIPSYPVVARAAYPGNQTEGHRTLGDSLQQLGHQQGNSADAPAAEMTAKATETQAIATASTLTSPVERLITLGNARSTTTMTKATHSVVSSSVAKVSDVSILGGIIHIASVTGQTQSTSNGKSGTATGNETSTGIEVAGQKFTVDSHGVHGPGGIALPGALGTLLNKTLPKTGNDLLQRLGVSFSLPTVQHSVTGTTGKAAGQGLVVSIDTGPLKKALSTLPIQTILASVPDSAWNALCIPDQLDALGGQLPYGKCLRQNLDAVLNFGPQIVFLFCNTMTAANAVPAVPFPGFPQQPGSSPPPVAPGSSGTPPLSGNETTPGFNSGSPGSPQVATPTTPTAATLPGLFGGISGGLLLLGILVTALAAYLLRGLGLPLFGVAGAAGCEYGAPQGAPDGLRRG